MAFVDSDDFVAEDYIEALLEKIGTFDIVCCSRYNVYNDKTLRHTLGERQYYDNTTIRRDYLNYTLFDQFKFVTFKLYTKEVIGSIRFDENFLTSEDALFNLIILKSVHRMCTTEYCGYYMDRRNLDSLTHKLQIKYTPAFEHSQYVIQRQAVRGATRQWNLSRKHLKRIWPKLCLGRCYGELMNLFLLNSPYNRNQIVEKIKEILADKEFVDSIMLNRYKNLSLREKVVKLCVQLNNPYFILIVFTTIWKVRRSRYTNN